MYILCKVKPIFIYSQLFFPFFIQKLLFYHKPYVFLHFYRVKSC